MFMEIDEVAVRQDLWALAKAADKNAIGQLRHDLNGVVLYMHALSTTHPPYTWVSIRELANVGVVDTVTLTTKGMPLCP